MRRQTRGRGSRARPGKAKLRVQPEERCVLAPPANRDALAHTRAAIAARIQAIVVHELDAIEDVLGTIDPKNPKEADRSARVLAQVARTARQLSALNTSEDMTPADDADDPVPRDIDEFRRELARRIRAFVDEGRSRDSA